jgi:hypothetical protein
MNNCHNTFFNARWNVPIGLLNDPNCESCTGCHNCCSTTQVIEVGACPSKSCGENPLVVKAREVAGEVFQCVNDDELLRLLGQAQCYRLRCGCDSELSVIYAAAHLFVMKSMMHPAMLTNVVASSAKGNLKFNQVASQWDLTVWGLLYKSLKRRTPAIAGIG